MFTLVRTLAALTLAAVLCGAAYWWHQQAAGPATPGLSADTNPGAGPGQASLPASAAPPGAIPNAVTAPAAPEPSLAAQVDALLATRDPQQAYAAFRLLENCLTFNRDGDRLIFEQADDVQARGAGALPGFRAMRDDEKRHDARLCPSMTERMRQSRIDYLELAARGGVAAAMIEQAAQGPFGDRSALATRPSDPLVREWATRVRQQLTRAAQEQGDPAVLDYLFAMHGAGSALFDQDAALAYRYGAALGMVYADAGGPDTTLATLYGPHGPLLRDAAAALSDEQRASALVEARRIADVVRVRRQQMRTMRTMRPAAGAPAAH